MITEKTLREELQEALQQGADHEALSRIVRSFYGSGGTKDQAYETLQEIWCDCGYDENDSGQPDRKRDDLEFMMERVWYWD